MSPEANSSIPGHRIAFALEIRVELLAFKRGNKLKTIICGLKYYPEAENIL